MGQNLRLSDNRDPFTSLTKAIIFKGPFMNRPNVKDLTLGSCEIWLYTDLTHMRSEPSIRMDDTLYQDMHVYTMNLADGIKWTAIYVDSIDPVPHKEFQTTDLTHPIISTSLFQRLVSVGRFLRHGNFQMYIIGRWPSKPSLSALPSQVTVTKTHLSKGSNTIDYTHTQSPAILLLLLLPLLWWLLQGNLWWCPARS